MPSTTDPVDTEFRFDLGGALAELGVRIAEPVTNASFEADESLDDSSYAR
jgi:hypothetical protein